jgi:hypothetical protein
VADIESTPMEEEVIEEAVGTHEIIANVRKVKKYFRFSSVKNGVLREKNQIRAGPQPRVNFRLVNLFKALKDPKLVSSKQVLDLAAKLLKIVENQKVLTMEEE